MTKKPKLISSIRAKLVSAVAMLLVAMIMVVSSTYAWFTLSTAPEVTGISTQIGANGALEMAMLPKTGDLMDISSTVGLSTGVAGHNIDLVNRTWGNLVDVSNNGVYGLNKIVLLPSLLNVSDEGDLAASLLKTPVYGSDGRVAELQANTSFGTYDADTGSFVAGNDYGLRGVGMASGMTPRQLAYRNALSQASTAASTASAAAASSLNAKGSTLANIVIKKATKADAAAFTKAEIESLLGITDDLLGTEDSIGALEHIENAYKQYLLAYAASKETTDESVWTLVQGAIDGGSLTFTVAADAVTVTVGEGETAKTVALPDSLATSIRNLYTTKSEVTAAQTALEALLVDATDETSFTWEQISGAVNKLAKPDSMTVNGFTPAQIKEDINKLVSSVQSGINVQMASGAGVYADIADHCGDYNAAITIPEVTYNGVTLENVKARMSTATTQTTPYLSAVATAMKNAGAPETGDTVMPLTEFYGYVLDLAFRTNAADSNLLLQTAPIDRIYDDNTNEATMGHGSSMTFASSSAQFSNEDLKALMGHIRIVFFTPNVGGDTAGTVLAYARLDAEHATLDANGWTANMYLVDGNNNFITNQTDAKITALNQNSETPVSALVYLDGSTITNADVATTATSMTGTANFQFSSSANLVPMEYANLHTPGAPAEGGEQPNP